MLSSTNLSPLYDIEIPIKKFANRINFIARLLLESITASLFYQSLYFNIICTIIL